MKDKLIKIARKVIHELVISDSYRAPHFIDSYIQSLPKVPDYPHSKSLVDNWEKEIMRNSAKPKVVGLEGKSAVPNRVVGDEVMVTK